MNSTFKISALAVLVSIGVTGCHGYKDNSPINEPTVINKQDNIKKPVQPEKKPTQPKPEVKPEQPKPEVKPEQPKPEVKPEQPKLEVKPEQPKLEVKPEQPKPEVKPEQPKPEVKPEIKPEPKITQKGKGVTTDELPTVHFKNGKGVTANDLPEGKLPEPEKIISLDSQGVQWRVVSLSGYPANNTDKVSYTYDDFEIANKLTDNTHTYFSHSCNDSGHCKGNVLTNRQQGSNGEIELNLDELAQKDGKPLLGFHKGEFYDKDLYGDVVEAHTNEKGELITTRTPASEKPIKYQFINQPYSSYGMIYTNENDIVEFFFKRNAGEKGKNRYSDFDVYRYETVDVNGKAENRIVWNDSIKGSTTYKGNVIASTTTENNLPHFSQIRTEPKLDGTVTLNANFGDSWDRTYVSGEIDSQTIGKIKLPRTAISDDLSTRYQGNDIYKAMRDGDPLKGDYHVKFGGKDLNDAVGQVDLFRYRNENGAINRYNTVFGATKQPK